MKNDWWEKMVNPEQLEFQKETLKEILIEYEYGDDLQGFTNDVLAIIMAFMESVISVTSRETFEHVWDHLMERFPNKKDQVREIFDILTLYRIQVFELENDIG